MTLIGDATAIHAGDVAAVAVYAGAVKVWPTAAPLPPADQTSQWMPGGTNLIVGQSLGSPPHTGSVITDVPRAASHGPGPATLVIGVETINLQAAFPAGLTGQQAGALWDGNRVRFTWTFTFRYVLSTAEVLGPTP
jgi:hypothetical protein